VCHALLQNPNFLQLLLQIDIELAAQSQAGGCHCGGVLHCANYPRKPRCCLGEARADYESRFSFCCSQCRKRTTSMSVRFLGRRVYLGRVKLYAFIFYFSFGVVNCLINLCKACLSVAPQFRAGCRV